MQTIFRFAILSVLAMFLYGCGSLPYNVVKPAVTEPVSDKAMIVFMRPDRGGMAFMMGSAGGSGTYAMLYQGDKYIGQLLPKHQLAYEVEPGKYNFMLAGFTADFMEAEVQAGKKYFVNIETIPMGIGIGFKFRPQNGQQDQAKLEQMHKAMKRVEPNEAGQKFAANHESKRMKLKEKYYTQWQNSKDRTVLNSNAGM